MHAGRQPAARHRRRRAPRIGNRGGEGAALLPALGHPSPRAAGGRDRRAAAAARRPRHPAHRGRTAAGRPRRRDPRSHRCRRRRAVGPRRADRRPRAPGRLRLGDRIARAGGRRDAGGPAPRPADQPDRHPSARGDRAAAHRQGRGRGHLPLRRDRARARRRPPPPPARRPGLRAVIAARERAERAARRDVDRRLPAMPQPPAGHVRRRRLRSTDRIQLRRHGRDAGPRLRRARRGDPDRAGPARPPDRRRRRDRAAGLGAPHLRRDVRRAAGPARPRRSPRRPRRGRRVGDVVRGHPRVSLLRAGDTATPEYALEITPERARWSFSGLRVLELAAGASHALETGEAELVVLPLEGAATVAVDGERFALDGRDGVFAAVTDVVYAPPDARVEIASEAGGRFALPSARASKRLEPRYVAAGELEIELRGAGRASRQINNFLGPDVAIADRLIAVEVLTPAGNWSSYPPHKHDEDIPGRETALEEIYYFEVAPSAAGDPGLAYQRVYGSGPGREIDVTAEVRSGDVIILPHGYHGPSMAAPGYDLYYLNVMAGGGERAWRFNDDPTHAWVRATWEEQELDPRLPLTAAPRRTIR